MPPSTLIKLTQMVDLAVGSPEPGALNLNVLHSLLHVIIQQMQIDETKVEFRGNDSDRMQSFLSAASPYPSLKLSEYVLFVDSKERVVGSSKEAVVDPAERQKVDSKQSAQSEGKHKVVLVQPFDDGLEESTDEHAKEKSKIRPGTPIQKLGGKQSSPKVGLRQLERTVSQLQADVAAITQFNMPTNQELLDSVRQGVGTEAKPINDMWETLKLAKRMDGAEKGVEKLTSMVEDIARDISFARKSTAGSLSKLSKQGSEDLVDRITTFEKRLWDIEHRLGLTERRVSGTSTGGGQGSGQGVPPGTEAEVPVDSTSYYSVPPGGGFTNDEAMQLLRDELTSLRADLNALMESTKAAVEIGKAVPVDTLVDALKQIEEMKKKLEDISGVDVDGVAADGGEVKKSSKLGDLQAQVQASTQQLSGIDITFTNQMDAFQQQMAEMEKEMGTILERLNAGMPSAGDHSSSQDFGGFSELYGKIQGLQNDMDMIGNTANRLMDEREERQMHIDALLEQIEVLKTVKANKEDLEDALADKADQNIVNRKVSHDQFDAACDDLSRGLEEALAKLTNQETLWSQALDDIQREIENKLDKIEISPLKDFVNNKLKLLQERLKALAALRKETEAAGTKQRLLRNVNCLSCDKSVVQRLDEEGQSVPTEALPPHRSMKPYLTYELDAVRKQQRRLPGGGRNMNHFETAKQEAQQKGKCKDKDHIMAKSIDHLCNRYCGGSHTLTTPHQRVTRMGHFLTQWGPEAIQLDPSLRGTDGHSYKGQASKTAGSVTSAQRSPRGSVAKAGGSVDVIKSPPRGSITSAKPGTPPKLGSPSKGPTPPGSPPKSLRGTPPKSPRGTPPKTPTGSPPKSPKGTPPKTPTGTPPKTPSGEVAAVEPLVEAEAAPGGDLSEAPPGDGASAVEVPAGEDAPAEEVPADAAASATEAPVEEAPPAEEAPPPEAAAAEESAPAAEEAAEPAEPPPEE